jgi:nucleotide-binding universal stress UspA family protein
MYKKMLVPLDGSKLAESAFVYAKELAGRLDTKVDILQVVDPNEAKSMPVYQAYVNHSAEILKLGILEVQKKLGKRQEAGSIEVVGKLATGYPAEEILRYASDAYVDLIVMSTHGRSGIRSWVFGSVTGKILNTSPVPVLVIRPEDAGNSGFEKWTDITIIVPLDGSTVAESVLPHVQELGKQIGNDMVNVVLIRVCELLPTPPPPGPEVPFNRQQLIDNNWAACKIVTREYLAGIENHLKQTGLKVRSEPIEQLETSVATEIIEYANKLPSSLIVMSTCGRSGIGKWPYGSVAHKVLTGSSKLTLLVRPASCGDSPRC